MKKLISITLALSILFCAMAFTGCARQPTPKKATNIMEKYYKKYAKEYPDTIFGINPVTDINVLHIEEVHKDLVVAYAILILKDGVPLQARFSIMKKPFGWRAVSWENMGIAMRQSPQ